MSYLPFAHPSWTTRDLDCFMSAFHRCSTLDISQGLAIIWPESYSPRSTDSQTLQQHREPAGGNHEQRFPEGRVEKALKKRLSLWRLFRQVCMGSSMMTE